MLDRLRLRFVPTKDVQINEKNISLNLTSAPAPRSILPFQRGSLAQSVEQLTFNQLVRGSSPRRPTTFEISLQVVRFAGFFYAPGATLEQTVRLSWCDRDTAAFARVEGSSADPLLQNTAERQCCVSPWSAQRSRSGPMIDPRPFNQNAMHTAHQARRKKTGTPTEVPVMLK
jgi:hypothetical protein